MARRGSVAAVALADTRPAQRISVIGGLDPANYRQHSLHASECIWPEKNCYVDIWIELVHSLGLEPLAMLPSTIAVDFEGDQWTFYKPPHEDLRELYGIDVTELYAWRPLLEHAVEHLRTGKFISTEADSFWLPDTAGTDYRQQHVKTTIVLNSIDVTSQQLHYFHNRGYHCLEGEDFVRLFRVGAAPDPTFLPLFAELVRHDRAVALEPEQLRASSRALLRKYLPWRPAQNPIPRFRARIEQDLPAIAQSGMQHYHAWVFGTLRQLGAANELAAAYLRWLGSAQCETAAAACSEISNISKSLLLKIARAVNAKRALDASASFDQMTLAWERATAGLGAIA